MAAHERVREIGTLRAMGLDRRGVVGLFVLEGVVMGGVGGLLGALLGGGFNHKLSVDGIDLSSFVEAAGTGGIYDSLPMSSMLYTESSPWLSELLVYRRERVTTDRASTWFTEVIRGTAQRFGVRLTSALREHGLVEHSVWTESNNSLPRPNRRSVPGRSRAGRLRRPRARVPVRRGGREHGRHPPSPLSPHAPR